MRRRGWSVVGTVTAQTRWALLKGQDLLLQCGELQHPQRVVLGQEAPQGVPAPANSHHHVFAVQHLREQTFPHHPKVHTTSFQASSNCLTAAPEIADAD